MKKHYFYIITVLFAFISFSVQAQDTYKHFIIYGQSLSVGHQSYPVLSTENVANNYMIGDQIWSNYNNVRDYAKFVPLVGNYCTATKNKPKTRASDCIAECPLLGTVNHLQLKYPEIGKVVASSCGTSGRSIEDLSKESEVRDHYLDFTNAIRDAKTIADKNNAKIESPVVFWMQGEWNYQGYSSGLTEGSKPTADKDEYKSLFMKLKDNMQTDIVNQYSQNYKPVFITYQVGVQYIKGRNQSIGMAQLELSNEQSDVICAGPVYQMTDRGGHLDSNGYRWYGEMLGKVYYRTQVLGEDFKPLQPISITRESGDLKKVKIRFIAPKLPLVLDTLILNKQIDYGFGLSKNGILQTLTKVEVDYDCVYLTCANDIEKNAFIDVTYAGETTSGHGNLRDSDDYEAFYSYVDLDEKKTDGSYVFPRDADETTLRPSVEPIDETKNVIYNKKYPLYNFSVGFFYRLLRNVDHLDVPNLGVSSLEPANTNTTFKFFQDGMTLRLLKNESDIAAISIYDLSGRIQTLVESPFGAKYTEHSISNLKHGVYLAKAVVNENLIQTIKINVK